MKFLSLSLVTCTIWVLMTILFYFKFLFLKKYLKKNISSNGDLWLAIANQSLTPTQQQNTNPIYTGHERHWESEWTDVTPWTARTALVHNMNMPLFLFTGKMFPTTTVQHVIVLIDHSLVHMELCAVRCTDCAIFIEQEFFFVP